MLNTHVYFFQAIYKASVRGTKNNSLGVGDRQVILL